MSDPVAGSSGNVVVTMDRPQTPEAPPAEHFWKRYSPHQELPLSTVASLALHGMVAALILLLAWKLLAGREGVERRYWAREGGKWVNKS